MEVPWHADFIAGYLSGAAALVVGYPLDTVKVVMQTERLGNGQHFRSSFHCTTHILKNHGVSGFFRGMAAPLSGVGAINAFCFGVYGNSRRWLQSEGRLRPSLWDTFNAGCIAGAATSLLTSPAELVKILLQAQPDKFKGPIEAAKHIVKEFGLRGLFHGTWSTILRDSPSYGHYFVLYEWLRNVYMEKNATQLIRDSGAGFENLKNSSTISVSMLSMDQIKAADMTSMQCLMAGGWAGVISWVACAPFDRIKTAIQNDLYTKEYKSYWDCVRKLCRPDCGTDVGNNILRYKWSALFRGLGPVLMRAFPVNAVSFLVYDSMLRWYRDSH